MNKSALLVALSSCAALAASAQLRITEVQSSNNGNTHQDWWELTNFGSGAVNLNGYKFDDSSATIANSVTLSTSLSIAPGESIIFVETLTASEFRAWWGPNLKANAQIVTYTGSGLGLSSTGDAVNLWDASNALVDSVKFGPATAGYTFNLDPNTATFGKLSVLGVDGAFAAAQGADVGSPAAVPEPSTTAMLALGGLSLLAFRSLRSRRA